MKTYGKCLKKVKVECEDIDCKFNIKGFCTLDMIKIIHGVRGYEFACRECISYKKYQ